MLYRTVNPPKRHSFFLFGPRQTGKSSLLKVLFAPTKSIYINLLLSSEFQRLKRDPSLLAREISSRDSSITHILIDEIQRIPELLDEIHQILESPNAPYFVLTGSSARKLKRTHANLLGGRASTVELFPFTSEELGENFFLTKALSIGTLPSIYLEPETEKALLLLRGYVDNYIKEEIEAEAATRNLATFLRFLPLAAEANGQEINFSKTARTCLSNHNTVRGYYTILEQTLLGRFLLPLAGSTRQQLSKRPKFYFFDTGIIRAILSRESASLNVGTYEYGALFESWVINEVWRLNSYYKKNFQTFFYRTDGGAEVDLVLVTPEKKRYAIEIKSAVDVDPKDLGNGMNSLEAQGPITQKICVTNGIRKYSEGSIDFMPWGDFLSWVRQL